MAKNAGLPAPTRNSYALLTGASQGIGEAMARRGVAFGMDILYSAHSDKDTSRIGGNVRRVDNAELIASSDVVSLHCPLTDETRHLIDADALQSMKDTAYLVNTARGACVDEKALVKALQEGQIAGAGLDVYEGEPQISPELLGMENVVLLPHIGSATRQTREQMSALTARNILAVLAGEQAETAL